MQQVGILGGGFNPPHKAHLFVVTDALSSGLFDEIWVIPCYHHAFEKDEALIPFEQRLNMCKLAFNQWGNVKVLDVERKLQTQYTVDLMTNLIHTNPDTKFTLIVGSDNVEGMEKWKYWNILKNLVYYYIAPRARGSHWKWALPDISSTEIRTLLAAHKTNVPYVQRMLPEAVFQYIEDKKLYRGENP